jgi:transposase
MFVRIKTTPNSTKTAVQIVESIRKGKTVTQKIVRHIGYAFDGDELEKLKLLAESIKIKLEEDGQQLLLSPEKMAELSRKLVKAGEDNDDNYNVNLKELVEEQRLISGIHDVYGALFDRQGFANIFKNPARQKAMVDAFRNIVLARIANPLSKLASVDMLEENFGVSLDLQRVYRMMDLFDDEAVENLNDVVYKNTLQLFGNKIDVIFFDVTTIYFESFTSDDLKDLGYSKDLKFNQPQILLALVVNKEGFPIGYKVLPGSTYEGHTLIPMLMELRQRYQIGKVIMVADGGMCNQKNVDALEKEGFEYIIGARLKGLNDELKKKILDRGQYKGSEEYSIGRFKYTDNKILVVSYKASRARKDALDRQRTLERLKSKLEKQKNPKDYLSNRGYRKYIKVTGESTLELDEEKIKADSCWDGLHGVVTNAKEISEEEILKQYGNLWHVEEAFRITKHDLKVRPIFHWTPKRIKAHVAICFTAYALVRQLEYQVGLQYRNMSIEKIRQCLVQVQTSILYYARKKIRFALPSRSTLDAQKIYHALGLKRSLTPWIIKCSAQ